MGEGERLRGDLLLAFDLGFIAFGFGVLFAVHLVFPVPVESRALSGMTTPVLILGLTGSVLWLRHFGSIAVAAQITSATTFVVLALSTALHGGLQSPVLCLWTLLPIVAGLIAGRDAALLWSGMILVFMVGLFQAERTGTFVAVPVDAAIYVPSLLANLSIACAAAAAAVALYETINAKLRLSLEEERGHFRYEAGHDPLTGLPNRRLFRDLQENALRRAIRTKGKVGLFVIDLDGFKPVNDHLGHAAGDRTLEAVAESLRGFTRATDSVARLGGDEFAVLVELIHSVDDARIFAERLHEELATQLPVSASIGVALYPDHAGTLDELQEAADAAMYEAKSAGGNRFRMSAAEVG